MANSHIILSFDLWLLSLWYSLIPKDKIDIDGSNISSAQSKAVTWYPIKDLNISTPSSLIEGNMNSKKKGLNAMLGFLPLWKIGPNRCCMTLIFTFSSFLKMIPATVIMDACIFKPLWVIARENLFTSYTALLFCSQREEILDQVLHSLSIPGVS